MTYKKIGILALALTLAVTALAGAGRQESFTMKKDILVAKDEVQDNIFAIGGNVQVEGKVRQSVIVLGGTITVNGEVGDSVVGIGCNVVLKRTAVVKGDVLSLGGLLEKEPGCNIVGDTVYFKSSEIPTRFFKGGFMSLFTLSFVPFFLILRIISLFLWFMLALIVVGIFPRQVSYASSHVRSSFGSVIGIGILAMIVYIGLVILAALLSLLLIGIPILLALIALGVIIKIFGQVVCFHFFGESLARAFGNQKPAPLLAAFLGLIVISLIKFIPLVGFLFSLCLSLIGWGVVLRTKFGTTENWFHRRVHV